jgi:hypothetical protein
VTVNTHIFLFGLTGICTLLLQDNVIFIASVSLIERNLFTLVGGSPGLGIIASVSLIERNLFTLVGGSPGLGIIASVSLIERNHFTLVGDLQG